ncbi:hypothetical protein JCM19237_3576 [Photobacterium aphoticum]|uniref:Uncharacterized protein n=1 Tax=Photobacterium aphoticum TaxID=754436 RepID=A0A090QSE9_9GAMM|nr:hypothetical protein JCM19237_3576 [Photobacterium aphoticum]
MWCEGTASVKSLSNEQSFTESAASRYFGEFAIFPFHVVGD